jgi:hypothetical protein
MPDRYYQHRAEEDGWVYVYDFDRSQWLKYHNVSVQDLPASVVADVKEYKQAAAKIPVEME